MPWSEKNYLEWSKRKVQVEAKWHEGIFLGIKDESEVAVVGTPPGIVFREAFAEFQKRILEMVCCATASEEPPGNYNLELKEES